MSEAAGPITLTVLGGGLIYLYREEIKEGILFFLKSLLNSVTSSIVIETENNNSHKLVYAIKRFISENIETRFHIARDGHITPTLEVDKGSYRYWYSGKSEYFPTLLFFDIDEKKITIRKLGRDKTSLHDFLFDIYGRYNSPDEVISFYTSSYADNRHDWNFPIFRRPRNNILPTITNDMKKVIDDIFEFLTPETEQEYFRKGIPYRKGYLLYGPPGTGKSSIVEIIAKEKGMSVYLGNLNSNKLDDSSLINLISSVPLMSIICFDEIEKQLKSVQENDINVSEGGILSAIDGPQRISHGTIVIMTANSIEELDENFREALLRNGRIDEVFELKEKFSV